jgi:hypothetical protein
VKSRPASSDAPDVEPAVSVVNADHASIRDFEFVPKPAGDDDVEKVTIYEEILRAHRLSFAPPAASGIRRVSSPSMDSTGPSNEVTPSKKVRVRSYHLRNFRSSRGLARAVRCDIRELSHGLDTRLQCGSVSTDPLRDRFVATSVPCSQLVGRGSHAGSMKDAPIMGSCSGLRPLPPHRACLGQLASVGHHGHRRTSAKCVGIHYPPGR